MPSPNPDTSVRQFIEGDLSEDELQEALHRIADDPEARSLLQFEMQMTQDLASSPSEEPSPAFAKRTMEQVARAESSRPAPQTLLERWWRALTRPLITIPVRPVSTVAVLVIGIAVAWLVGPLTFSPPPGSGTEQTHTTTSMQTTAAAANQQAETVWTRFVYMADDAKSVAVAGDFSQWEPIPLSPRTVNDKTVWTGLVAISRGEHEYQFVIDGTRWVTDPLAPVKHDDGFGAKNAVLKL